jgi:hypothetical protein
LQALYHPNAGEQAEYYYVEKKENVDRYIPISKVFADSMINDSNFADSMLADSKFARFILTIPCHPSPLP